MGKHPQHSVPIAMGEHGLRAKQVYSPGKTSAYSYKNNSTFVICGCQMMYSFMTQPPHSPVAQALQQLHKGNRHHGWHHLGQEHQAFRNWRFSETISRQRDAANRFIPT
jgi:hypothetical protein